MVDSSPRAPGLETVGRWWLRPRVVLVSLLVVGTTLVLVAVAIYDDENPDSFPSVLATGVLLNGVAVFVLGILVTTALSVVAETRAREDAAAQRRLELFRRMRDAHVRATQTQHVLRAQRDTATYHLEMLALLRVVQGMGEIREEVWVSGRLYSDADRTSIRRGIAIIIDFLQQGFNEYVAWCASIEPRPDPCRDGTWVALLTADHDASRPDVPPEHDDWEAAGRMPPRYHEGLEQSKLLMRAYVYGASDGELRELRDRVTKPAEEAGGSDLEPPEGG